jgi:selenocysteine lyase/cysteine desulfurase
MLAALSTGITIDAARAFPVLEELAATPGSPEELARDEAYWTQIGQAFSVDRSLITLNNGGVCPSPVIVQNAMKRHLDYSNTAPSYALWRVLEPQREVVRARLARAFGGDPEEIAITRNASESLQICQLGIDLKPGDEILTTTQDYPRMLTTFEQRVRREGVVLRQIQIPVPCEDPAQAVRLFREGITDRTRVMLVSHVINLTGQIMPVREIAALGREKNIPVIVDGAHAFANLDFRLDQLACDYYGVSLHKWLYAPHGTGLLYVRKDKIASLWPMMAAAAEKDADIRKFEEIGTHPAANALAIAEAISFHEAMGAARKLARLLYLRDTWATRLVSTGRVKLHTSLKPGVCSSLGNFELEGVDSAKLGNYLWEKHRIIVTPIVHKEFQGVRVSPSVHNTLDELDLFCSAVERVARDGLPAA